MRHLRKMFVALALLLALLGPGIALAAPQSVAHATTHHQTVAFQGHIRPYGIIWGD